MERDISDNALVLLAIVQCDGKTTATRVEKLAKRLANAERGAYEGPKPNFNESAVFGSAWNELLLSGHLQRKYSTDESEPEFVDNSPIDAVSRICSTERLLEKQSFEAAIYDGL